MSCRTWCSARRWGQPGQMRSCLACPSTIGSHCWPLVQSAVSACVAGHCQSAAARHDTSFRGSNNHLDRGQVLIRKKWVCPSVHLLYRACLLSAPCWSEPRKLRCSLHVSPDANCVPGVSAKHPCCLVLMPPPKYSYCMTLAYACRALACCLNIMQ